MCAIRKRRESYAVYSVQHQTAGPFQKHTLLFELTEIDCAGVVRLQPGDEFRSSFQPAINGLHRIQHQGSILVRAEPIVWKERIGRLFVGRLKAADTDPRGFEPDYSRVEFS